MEPSRHTCAFVSRTSAAAAAAAVAAGGGGDTNGAAQPAPEIRESFCSRVYRSACTVAAVLGTAYIASSIVAAAVSGGPSGVVLAFFMLTSFGISAMTCYGVCYHRPEDC